MTRARMQAVAKILLAGVKYPLVYLKRGHRLLKRSAAHNGSECDAQIFYKDVENGPLIVVEMGQPDRGEMESLIHEGLHGIAPGMLAEEWIDARAKELTALLYDGGGFRKNF